MNFIIWFSRFTETYLQFCTGFEERFQKEAGLCSSAIRPALVKVIYSYHKRPFLVTFSNKHVIEYTGSIYSNWQNSGIYILGFFFSFWVKVQILVLFW